jgi:hypothetical protein
MELRESNKSGASGAIRNTMLVTGVLNDNATRMLFTRINITKTCQITLPEGSTIEKSESERPDNKFTAGYARARNTVKEVIKSRCSSQHAVATPGDRVLNPLANAGGFMVISLLDESLL